MKELNKWEKDWIITAINLDISGSLPADWSVEKGINFDRTYYNDAPFKVVNNLEKLYNKLREVEENGWNWRCRITA